MISSDEAGERLRELKGLVVAALERLARRVSFEELRDFLEAGMGVYVDGLLLRKVVAEMVRGGELCKEVSAERHKLLLRLCK